MKKKCLYLGTDPRSHETDCEIVHVPFIEIVPRDFDSFEIKHQFDDILEYTHFILTSKNAVKVFFDALEYYKIDPGFLSTMPVLAIGAVTSSELNKYHITHQTVAKEATQEGVMELLETLDLENAYLFYPRSAKSRPTLSFYLRLRGIRHQICDLYDTKSKLLSELPDLDLFHEVVFTSPTTVKAFFSFFTKMPPELELKAIGPITRHALNKQLI
ncbi:MAG: hypothetical protein S4CHLAM37_02050 [Chlamydiia bacterium]|nr:hypothetical protein [Chlamydiia bacterium]